MIQKNYQRMGNQKESDNKKWMMGNDYKKALCILYTYVFEANFAKNTFHSVKNNWKDTFGYLPKNYDELYERAFRSCHVEDKEKFKKIFSFSELNRAWNRGEEKCSMECRLKVKGQGYKWFYFSVVLYGDERGHLKGVIGCGRDRNEHKEKEAIINYHASHDALTDTWNWRAGSEVLNKYMKLDNRYQAVFILLCIEDFKELIDQYGSPLGEKLLKNVANIMQSLANEEQKEPCLIRYSGDEFVLFFEIENTEQVRQLLNKMLQKMMESLVIDTMDGERKISTSIGVSLYPKHGKTTERLLECADSALRHSKMNGKNQYTLYDRMMEVKEDKYQIVREQDRVRWEDSDDIVSMSNPVTHELYYINRIGREYFGLGNDDYKGRKCYEVLQGRPDPCPFCKASQLKEGETILSEQRNEKLNRDFLVKDRLIRRDGRTVHVEVAIDISEKEK